MFYCAASGGVLLRNVKAKNDNVSTCHPLTHSLCTSRQKVRTTNKCLSLEQSPTDYVLYYKRATAYYSLSKHHSALQDFDKVLDLTNFTFDKALLMKGRIHAKEGDWNNAKDMLKRYKARASGKDATEAGDLVFEVSEGETAAKKAKQSRKAGLYQACVEAATDALKTATHSVQLRQLRADCALEAGDVQQAVGDMMYVSLSFLYFSTLTIIWTVERLTSPHHQRPNFSESHNCPISSSHRQHRHNLH